MWILCSASGAGDGEMEGEACTLHAPACKYAYEYASLAPRACVRFSNFLAVNPGFRVEARREARSHRCLNFKT